MSGRQLIQDEAYSFPYHYISSYEDNFRHFLEDSWGMAYCASIEFLIDELKAVQFDTLIDVGCGDGRLVRELGKAFQRKNIVGVDTSKRAINLALALNPDLNFICSDISEVKSRFDVITLIEVLEHIPIDSIELFLSSLSKILNNYGMILLTVPSLNRSYDPRHYQHFSVDLLLHYLDSKFEIIDLKYIERIPGNMVEKLIFWYLNNSQFIIKNRLFLSNIYRLYKSRFICDDYVQSYRIYLKLQKRQL